DPAKHVMHAEWADVSETTVKAIQECNDRGGRVIAIGTTATRALESAAAEGVLRPWRGETRLFIHPPYEFKVVDGMVTNFHLPRTTLLLLVGALAGMDFLKEAYTIAVREKYRFYSYGDAMLVV
ncbi:MAG: S-adenosylmethionine:tRNA ribosyltransferase-isomerase, partial [Planctomycetes bacterium]|nr:S-adenosylmethionine:tRNA ribosyltransferase-isomerase [Planctomycetota bacterium]